MFLYIFRFILLFWIISIVIKWAERLFSPGAANRHQQQQHRPPDHTTTDPESAPSMGKIVDAEFEDLDGDR